MFHMCYWSRYRSSCEVPPPTPTVKQYCTEYKHVTHSKNNELQNKQKLYRSISVEMTTMRLLEISWVLFIWRHLVLDIVKKNKSCNAALGRGNTAMYCPLLNQSGVRTRLLPACTGNNSSFWRKYLDKIIIGYDIC